ncbi:CHRD domain-containing protein [Egicoccus sp. AB-alg6-2]|uniref:CHRD domain-containing protein n=1 Tax=Egicoccus sp. AB-alg6-2 TaxID=3242692 RepID=UPI00359E6696
MRTRLALLLSLSLAATLLAAPLPLAAAGPGTPQTSTTRLAGANEVPAVESHAAGTAIVRFNADRTTMTYRLVVTNLHDVTMAHIHLAPAGQNGPVVVWLYPSGPPPQLLPGRTNGVLASGTITAADLVGPLAGHTLDSLAAAIAAGDAYVNVHTAAFPAGEIRGQL